MTRSRELAELGSAYDSGNGLSFRNRIINGDMRIDQRNAGASVTPASAQYVVDRFRYTASQASRVTQQRSTTAPSGFTNSLLTTVATAATAASTDFFGVEQLIEGFNVADLGWGTASAQSVTLSFWARSSATGTYSLRLTNEAANRSYVATYTISAANTFEYKTVTVPGDTSGTWQTNSAAGITVWWDLGSGSNYNGTAGSWVAGNFTRTAGSVNWIATNGATFYITGVQLEAGTVATPFERRPYGTEELLCDRYARVQRMETSGYNTNSFAVFTSVSINMRATPTITQLANNVSFTQSNVTASTSLYIASSKHLSAYRIAASSAPAQFSETVLISAEL